MHLGLLLFKVTVLLLMLLRCIHLVWRLVESVRETSTKGIGLADYVCQPGLPYGDNGEGTMRKKEIIHQVIRSR
jgi:hypothetical protein